MSGLLPTLYHLAAGELAAQIRRKEIRQSRLQQSHLDRIARLNPKLDAFVDYNPEARLTQARLANT